MRSRIYIVTLILSLFLYFLVRFTRLMEYEAGDFFLYHLTDLLFVVLVLSFILLLIRIVRRVKDFRFRWWQIAGLVVFYAVYFEYYLPGTAERYTADYWDVLMYVLGGFLFYGIQKFESRRKKEIILSA